MKVKLFAMTMISGLALYGCGNNASDDAAAGSGAISGPYPTTITGTIDGEHHVDSGAGMDMIWFSEYEGSNFYVESPRYNQLGLAEGKTVTVEVKPGDVSSCGGQEPCFEIL